MSASASEIAGGANGALLADLQRMEEIRAFEDRTKELRMSGRIIGSVHLCTGQEAIPVGACSVLEPGDAVFATYRGHGWALACGSDPRRLFAELLGRETGTNGGRGGSAYLSDPDVGFYGENSIVGAGAPIAMGAALAARYDGSGRVAVCAFGDGAMNQGAVHEAMNMAAAFDLPVVYVCENNEWSELTAVADVVRDDRLHRRAAAYGMPGERIDGNDPDAVRDAVGRAVALAREGGGPSLVEAMTRRIAGHYIGDREEYRRPGEMEEILAAEPLVRARKRLVAEGVEEAALDDLRERVREEMDAAASAALNDPPASTDTVKEHVHA